MSRLFLTITIDNKHFAWTVIALKNDDCRALALIDCESTSLFIIYMSLVKGYSANESTVSLQSISHKIMRTFQKNHNPFYISDIEVFVKV